MQGLFARIFILNIFFDMDSLDLVREYYACFNRKDWAGMLALLASDVQHDANQGDTYFGIDHFREFLQHMDACYDETLHDQVFMRDATGTRIATEFVVHGIYKKTDSDLPPATGQKYVLPAGAFLEVANGKIRRVTTYYNLPLWIKLISQ